VREADGLAMSSRNAYLTPDQRAAAPTLYRVLSEVADRLHRGEPAQAPLAWGRASLQEAGFAPIDYLELRDVATLVPLAAASHPARLLAAAWLGKTRLIDNVAVVPAS
jgi:pantoate--beta-alanine ligase